ncbi:MAG: hypothetical protein ACTSV7_15085 [Candidatus Baldrarchaeia archaeon]
MTMACWTKFTVKELKSEEGKKKFVSFLLDNKYDEDSAEEIYNEVLNYIKEHKLSDEKVIAVIEKEYTDYLNIGHDWDGLHCAFFEYDNRTYALSTDGISYTTASDTIYEDDDFDGILVIEEDKLLDDVIDLEKEEKAIEEQLAEFKEENKDKIIYAAQCYSDQDNRYYTETIYVIEKDEEITSDEIVDYIVSKHLGHIQVTAFEDMYYEDQLRAMSSDVEEVKASEIKKHLEKLYEDC